MTQKCRCNFQHCKGAMYGVITSLKETLNFYHAYQPTLHIGVSLKRENQNKRYLYFIHFIHFTFMRKIRKKQKERNEGRRKGRRKEERKEGEGEREQGERKEKKIDAR